ncbi:MAG TPA: site-specific integrase [Phycisphaerae bacterium]|nr:site-specific integrase [Phycisphaerae bacterium]
MPAAHVHAALVKCPRMVRLMIRLQALTGVRPAEVCNLRACDVDRSGDLWVYSPPEHKTAWRGKTRSIHFGPRARRLLTAVLRRWPATGYVFSPERGEADRLAERHARRVTPPSCTDGPGTHRVDHRKRPPGDHYDVAAYRRAITRACELAGVPDWSPNQRRHSFATRVRRDYGLEAAQILLGHSSALVTDAVYAERDEGRARAIAAKRSMRASRRIRRSGST